MPMMANTWLQSQHRRQLELVKSMPLVVVQEQNGVVWPIGLTRAYYIYRSEFSLSFKFVV